MLENSLIIFFSMLASSPAFTPTSDPIVIGHRGAKGYITENTMASVDHAFDMQADGVEIDVFRIQSGEIVVFHDEQLDRLTGAPGKIEDQNWTQVKQLRVVGGHAIPLLTDVLERIPKGKQLNIELKGPETAAPVYDLLLNAFKQGYLEPDQIVISSFNWDELQRFRESETQLEPDLTPLKLGVLTENDPLLALAVAKSLNAFSIHPNFRQLDERVTKTIKDAGYQLYVWTVNTPEDIQRMKALQVEAIITDYPDRVHP